MEDALTLAAACRRTRTCMDGNMVTHLVCTYREGPAAWSMRACSGEPTPLAATIIDWASCCIIKPQGWISADPTELWRHGSVRGAWFSAAHYYFMHSDGAV